MLLFLEPCGWDIGLRLDHLCRSLPGPWGSPTRATADGHTERTPGSSRHCLAVPRRPRPLSGSASVLQHRTCHACLQQLHEEFSDSTFFFTSESLLLSVTIKAASIRTLLVVKVVLVRFNRIWNYFFKTSTAISHTAQLTLVVLVFTSESLTRRGKKNVLKAYTFGK